MATVKVYRFKRYEIASDGYAESRRYATLNGIASVNAVPIEETMVEVEEDQIHSEIPGMMPTDWRPSSFGGGFQTHVKS
jgi:hypothetical protein